MRLLFRTLRQGMSTQIEMVLIVKGLVALNRIDFISFFKMAFSFEVSTVFIFTFDFLKCQVVISIFSLHNKFYSLWDSLCMIASAHCTSERIQVILQSFNKVQATQHIPAWMSFNCVNVIDIELHCISGIRLLLFWVLFEKFMMESGVKWNLFAYLHYPKICWWHNLITYRIRIH